MSNDSVPQRMSDADRDAAVAMLREHFEAGRLDQTEFSDRLDKALAARYAVDLAPLFGDLPDPRPPMDALGYPTFGEQPLPWQAQSWSSPPFPRPEAAPPVQSPDSAPPPFPQLGAAPQYSPMGHAMEPRPGSSLPSSQQNWLPMARKLLWPVAIVLGIVTDAFMMWIVIAIIGSIVLGQLDSRTRKPPPYLGS